MMKYNSQYARYGRVSLFWKIMQFGYISL